MTITSDYIEENVIEWVDRYQLEEGMNEPYPSSFKQASYNKNSTESSKLSEELKNKLLELFLEKLPNEQASRVETYTQISVQKYEVGDYIKPHVDNYQWNCTIILSDDPTNGVVFWNSMENKFKFVEDSYGKLTEIPSNTYHWISPVRNQTRYTVVLLESTESEDPNPAIPIIQQEEPLKGYVPASEDIDENTVIRVDEGLRLESSESIVDESGEDYGLPADMIGIPENLVYREDEEDESEKSKE
jgi:hypothetical protein